MRKNFDTQSALWGPAKFPLQAPTIQMKMILHMSFPSHSSGHISALINCAIKTILGRKTIFVSSLGNWFWHFHPHGKILISDFLSSWMTVWCGMDSKVLEKVKEVPNSLREGQVHASLPDEKDIYDWFQWAQQVTENAQLYLESSYIKCRVGSHTDH